MMEKTIARILSDHGIEYFGQLPASEAQTLKPPMEGVRAYVMMLLPYHTAGLERNVALFACFPDYHALTRELLGSVCAELGRSFPGETFKATVDSSPIAEVDCAAKCGLGAIGDNGLLINERYGSYCFIAEIATTLELPLLKRDPGAAECLKCGACVAACPHGALSADGFTADKCVSHVSQKKGQLTPEEEEMIASADFIWGCDRCQDACPLNAGLGDTRLECFKATAPIVTEGMINDPAFFNASAFAWRGKATILRNIALQKRKNTK